MDSIVTARVPAGIKEQAKSVLQEIGATPTDLVNAAYKYVLATGQLPAAEEAPISNAGMPRKLAAEQVQELKDRFASTTFAVPSEYWEDNTDEEMLEQALREKYAGAR